MNLPPDYYEQNYRTLYMLSAKRARDYGRWCWRLSLALGLSVAFNLFY